MIIERRVRGLALLLLAAAAMSATSLAQIEKLPIASQTEIVEHTAKYLQRIDIQVVSIARLADGSVAISNIADEQFPYENTPGTTLPEFVRQTLIKTITDGIDVNRISFPTATFGVSCTGNRLVQSGGGVTESMLFFTGNNFTLNKTAAGAYEIPASAYELDVVGAIADQDLVWFYFADVKRVLVEILDENGRILDTQDSDKHQDGEATAAVAREGFALPMKDLLGKNGKVTLMYQGGGQQVFNLDDGSPYQPAATDPFVLSAPTLNSTGIEFTVQGNEGDVIVIEMTSDLATAWIEIGQVTNFAKPADTKSFSYSIQSGSQAFFRGKTSARTQP